MKCLILAAGYGTRMQAVTGDIPKALIRLGDQTILELLMQRLEPLDIPCTLITNQKYHDQFVLWQRSTNVTMTILSNGTEHVDERLGAVGDICFALETGQLDDDLLIVAADTLFDFPLRGLIQIFQNDRYGVVAVRHNPDPIDLRRRGVVEVDSSGRITGFTEKPDQPASDLASTPLYILPRELLTEPARYLSQGGNPDAPGYLMEYLVARHPLNAWRIPGEIRDVGNPDSYSAAVSQSESSD
jgi:glucose-1-phosphate thymidylyltransferase